MAGERNTRTAGEGTIRPIRKRTIPTVRVRIRDMARDRTKLGVGPG